MGADDGIQFMMDPQAIITESDCFDPKMLCYTPIIRLLIFKR
jgi:hypothetical protein